MTLAEFTAATAGMPASTTILILAPWGGMAPATLVTVEDLTPGDPVRDAFPHQSILLAESAD